MAIHPSLRAPDKSKKQRSVLKRAERLKAMIEKGDWKEGDDIYNLPKMKTLRIKIKKEKAEKVEAAATAEGATGAVAAPAAAPKEQAKAAPKAQEKK